MSEASDSTAQDVVDSGVPEPVKRPMMTRRGAALGLVLIALMWIWSAPGLASSNDGSHLALSRAQVLRGETTLGPEVAFTLWVDRARREGKQYSDRPPGTAWLAGPAVWLGAQLDPLVLQASMQTKELFIEPAAGRYAETYGIRVQRMHVLAPPLLALQGTALMLGVQSALMGIAGLLGVMVLLRRRNIGRTATRFAIGSLALASLWGPYSTVLFSHVTAGAALVWTVVALEYGVRNLEADGRTRQRARMALVGAGMIASWAVAADYLMVVLVLGIGFATVPRRTIVAVVPWCVLGAVPVVLGMLAYHDAAFGSPWSIGYDHHANFKFARERASTFSGNTIVGLWSQWGAGDGAGVLALAPVMLMGIVGLAAQWERRWLLGALPWILLLATHRTPTGGAVADHRYLVPLMPLLAVGLGLMWQRWVDKNPARWVAPAMVVLAGASAWLSWSHEWGVWG